MKKIIIILFLLLSSVAYSQKNYICAGPAGCLPIDMKANGTNIFSSKEECMYKCKKPVKDLEDYLENYL